MTQGVTLAICSVEAAPAVSSWGCVLLVALLAVHRSALCRLEGNLALGSAVCADRLGEFPGLGGTTVPRSISNVCHDIAVRDTGFLVI